MPMTNSNGMPVTIRREGTALIEFVMAVPLFGLVIMLIFFFGWALTNQQHVRVADRYTAWRVVTGGGTSPGKLNQMFFMDRAVTTSISGNLGPTVILESLVAAADGYGVDAGALADRLVMGTFSRGREVKISASFKSTITTWRRFGGAISSRHAREGSPWRRGQATCERALSEQPLRELDEVLGTLPPPADTLGPVLRGLYLRRW